MNLFSIFCFLCGSLCFVSSKVLKNTQFDLIIHSLEEQDWQKDETKCLADTLLILNNVKNHTLWAVWIWNSMQHPTGTFYGSRYSLGNYDQCLKAPSVARDSQILTQYCLVDVKLTDDIAAKERKVDGLGMSDEFFKERSKVGRNFNLLTWGTCLPASCNPRSIPKVLKTIYSVNPLASADPEIIVDNCQIAGETPKYGFLFYLFIAFVASLISAAILSTIYVQHNTEDTRLRRIAYSFSLERNWSSFIKTSADEIPVLSFTKSVILIVTTCSHSFVFAFIGAISNGSDFDNLINEENKNILGSIIKHIDLPTVDNFFVISGLLVMKSLMEKKRNVIVSLIQRYVRLIGSLVFIVFYTLAVYKYTGDGPLWNKLTGRELQACEENWFLNLLMVNNYVNNAGICQLITWYVPCDYQLALLATLLFCIWQWNKRVGKIVATLATFLALVLPGIVTYWNRYPGILLYDVEQIINYRTNVVYLDTYMKTHNRAGPYLLGMAAGYILTTYRPAKYRAVISRTWSYIGLVLASLLAFRVWTSAGEWCLMEYSAWDSAVYAALNRNIWALASIICIFISTYGDVPELQPIITWPGFTIGSRLAYGVYMSHSLILQRNIYSQRNPIQYDMFSLTVNGLGVFAASSVLAILLWLFVEAPLSNLTNLILIPRKQAVNGIKTENSMNGDTIVTELKNGKTL